MMLLQLGYPVPWSKDIVASNSSLIVVVWGGKEWSLTETPHKAEPADTTYLGFGRRFGGGFDVVTDFL